MKRRTLKYDVENFINEYNIEKKIDVEIYVDYKNKNEIASFLKNNNRKFAIILYHFFQGINNEDLYRKEPYGLKAMKIKGFRIYCKEIKKVKRKMSY